MERTYRASNWIWFYTTFLLLDAFILTIESANRVRAGAPFSGVILGILALICLGCATLLAWRCGRLKVTVRHDAVLVNGDGGLPRNMHWEDVDLVREIRGPAYQLSLRRLLPGPYLPHTLFRGETVLEVLARPAMRIVFRQALIRGYGTLREDVVRASRAGGAEVDLHARWWRT